MFFSIKSITLSWKNYFFSDEISVLLYKWSSALVFSSRKKSELAMVQKEL